MEPEELLFDIDQLRIKYRGQKIDIEKGSEYINEAIELIEQFKKDELADFMQWLIDEKYCLQNPIEDCVDEYLITN